MLVAWYNERGYDDTNDECHEQVHEHANEPIGNKKVFLPLNQYNRQKQKIKKQKINVVFNNSKIVLTEDMIRVLNRGLKFAILPLKLDISQVLTDFRRFERTMIWKEFWFGKDSEPYVPPIFKQNSIISHKTTEPLRASLTFWQM